MLLLDLLIVFLFQHILDLLMPDEFEWDFVLISILCNKDTIEYNVTL